MNKSGKIKAQTLDDLALLINPFKRIAGWRAFSIGLVFIIITVLAGWKSGIISYGLDIKASPGVSLADCFYATGIGLGCYLLLFYITSLIFAKGTRFQDVIGSVTISRAPYLLASIFGFLFKSRTEGLEGVDIEILINSIDWGYILPLIIMAFGVSIWAITILYNSYKVSTGLKGKKYNYLFIQSLMLAEIFKIFLIFKIF